MYAAITEQQLILIASTAIIILLIILFVAALLIQRKRKFMHSRQLSDLRNKYEMTILQTELKIQEETFKAISQNLHDNIGSNISTAMLLLYEDKTLSTSELNSNRQEAMAMLDRIVDDLKNIARSLNPAYLEEHGLKEAIQLRVQQLQKTRRYTIKFDSNEPNHVMDKQKQIVTYYIFQEALNNIARHAGASAIDIQLHFSEAVLSLSIKDNGKGFKINTAPGEIQSKGSGLLNMRQHATIINGELTVSGNAGEGTAILLNVKNPCDKVSNR